MSIGGRKGLSCSPIITLLRFLSICLRSQMHRYIMGSRRSITMTFLSTSSYAKVINKKEPILVESSLKYREYILRFENQERLGK